MSTPIREWYKKFSQDKTQILLVVIALLAVQAVVLSLLGQPPICRCGYVTLWVGNVLSPENSQQLSDWYSFTHIVHGILLYLGLWYLFPDMSIKKRLIIALSIEVGWEIIENTHWIIDAYRQQALSQGYTGDAIVNSLSDSCFMLLGFALSRKLPVSATVMLAISLEIILGFVIRDNLTLNIINFIHPFTFIQRWQSG